MRSRRSAGCITVTHGWRPDPNLPCCYAIRRPLGVHRPVAFRALNRPAPVGENDLCPVGTRLLTFDLALGRRLERANRAGTCARWGFQERQPDHPLVATTLENYAALLRDVGREDEAAAMEARAEAISAKRAEENR